VSRRVRFAQRLISVVVTVFMVSACVLAALMVLPTLLGYERYVIISGSMEPTLSVGTIVYDEVVPVEDISVGDIITFVPPPEYGIDEPVTHRVVQVVDLNLGQPDQERMFRTKGDANDAMDPWRMVLDGPDQARVAHQLPYFGYFYMALQVRWVQVLVIVVPAIALVVYVLITMWRVSGDAIKEERAQAQQETQGVDEPGEVTT
jgi:signal peptidase I